MRVALVASAALGACLALCAAPALAVTAAPELVSPHSLTKYKSPLPIEYTLPENAGASGASLEFIPVGGGSTTTLTLTASASDKGTHSFVVETDALAADTSDVRNASASTLADGKYNVVLSYQDEAGDAAAVAVATAVEIKTTTPSPTLHAPAATTSYKSPLTIDYTLPEVAATGAAWLLFTPTGSASPVTLTLTASASTAGTHSFALNTHELEADATDIEHASASSLPDGEYTVTVLYQEELENEGAEASAEGVVIKNATPLPTVLLPSSSSLSRSPLTVRYVLQEAAMPGTATLELLPTSGPATVVTLDSEASSAGTHTLALNFASPSSSSGVASVVPVGAIAEGEYTVKLAYQEALGNPSASASVSGVRVKMVTTAPTLTAPVSARQYESPLTIEYALAEAASSAGAHLTFTPRSGSPTVLQLTSAASSAGLHSFTLDLHNLLSNTSDVREATPGAALAEGEYTVTLSYQDVVENAAATSSAAGVAFAFPKCAAGSYSATGEPPCMAAPAGFYVGEAGATVALECHAGRYAANPGMTLCAPATPGHYVPSPGASSQLECPAGSYAPAAASSSCTTTPPDTYATSGAIESTPCPSGTVSAAGASSCSAPSATSTQTGAQTTQAGGVTTLGSAATPGDAAAATLKVEIAPAKHLASLLRTRAQRYRVSCSVASSVLVRVSVLLRVGPTERLEIAARPQTLRCSASSWTETSASFKLTKVARALLSQHRAGVKLRVRVYPVAGAGSGRLALSTVLGRR